MKGQPLGSKVFVRHGLVRRRPSRLLFGLAMLTIPVAAGSRLFAQDHRARALAERSAIVVDGKVLKTNASEEPMLKASDRTAVILVRRMHAGRDIVGDQAGRTVTVILSRAGSLKIGDEALFFGNPRFAGKTLTIADEGEIVSKNAAASSDLQRGMQARKDKPILGRLASASLVFRGTVEAVRPLEAVAAEGKRPPALPTEHDPEWHVATVRVSTPLRGGDGGQVLTVLFPASRDIVWFHAPKLKPGQDAVFLAHLLTKENAARYRAAGVAASMEKPPAYFVAEPSDVLPASEEGRVRGLLSSAKEAK